MDSDEIVPPEASQNVLPEKDLDEKYPNRPHNRAPTLAFHELYLGLFNPLSEIKKKPTGPAPARRKVGPQGKDSASLNPFERRRDVIERFISRWRKEVGDDIYPAFRLILPDKDRDRPMYGIKEKVIGKMLVKIMKINKESEDGYNLLNWKLPGQTAATRMAGDFAGRCYDVLSKRPMRTEPGDMTIAEVNDKLDKLSAASKEDQQLPILAEFYRRMNPEELMWLIRIILRQMKVGATERTFFDVWHPDAENLYSISSSLRRVCWELHDPNIRLEAEDRGISLMQCFQPQLAQFQMHSFDKMVARMRPTEEDRVFWIEEKLDGERMQLHMAPDESVPGSRRFGFWSRKAKEYTYLYGNGIEDENGALTRHLKDAFVDGVQSLILDGEMITWDPEQDAPVPFGTLKTAALAEQRNPFSNGPRPLFRVFDMLYLNGRDLTKYTLRDRRNALQKTIRPVHRRFEIHPYEEATTTTEVETSLRKVVAEASEGLVLKNPRSPYRLNERHDDWMKVKPEYMTEFGESLDVVVVGGYFGSGRRGGALSSFLCGLRVDDAHFSQGEKSMKCWSFCKVGGGFTAADYQEIRHHTDGKWKEWDAKRPPTAVVELAGGDAQHERPDMWIKPSDSVVLCVKAASVSVSDQFRMGLTLRFPRFKKLRKDKNWECALSVQEFLDLKSNAEQEHRDKEFSVDNSRRKRVKRTTKKPLTIAGYEEKDSTQYLGPSGHVFDELNFFVLTESTMPEKRSKTELEQLVKANGGKIYQTNTAAPDTICVAERRTVKVASLQKSGQSNIIRPSWLLDCVSQNTKDAGLPDFLLPFEPRHMFFVMEDKKDEITGNVDLFMDSYARDTTVDELKDILKQMEQKQEPTNQSLDAHAAQKVEAHIQEKIDAGYTAPCGWLFRGLTLFFPSPSKPRKTHCDEGDISGYDAASMEDPRLRLARNTARFAGAQIATSLNSSILTHVVVNSESVSSADISSLRGSLAARLGKKVPYLVGLGWLEESWDNGTLLDEERFQVR
ncbi:Nucleic acid-binding OB-fold-containing protein [Penicillium alfredii]|uniref:DNA ligase n=1 Tax=Penicillium alfredii TaxID=1506179 RepID=A0A9W9FKG9_9EURO|nr:Nucleic acid-binding OB-fold-containing protein [Penicillium alfredii]KAJ5101780.1 Nucleic acid-binding OB-fold-containing protein [Penicillium alfredii]